MLSLIATCFAATAFAARYDSSDESESYSDSGDCRDHNWEYNSNYKRSAERTYYIGCVEEEWDYAPSGKDLLADEKIEEYMQSGAHVWLYGNEEDRIGRKYIKSRYVEYTDECFEDKKERHIKYEHVGVLGPVIRALTGETIKIFYRNFCSFPSSMHPHGVKYDKDSEGAPYADGSTDGDTIEPGNGWIYIWEARPDTVDDHVSSQMWLYHSHVDETRDVLSGLMGGIVITKKGYETNYHNLMPTDVSREFFTFFVMFDENNSHFLNAESNDQIEEYLTEKDYSKRAAYELKEDLDFIESNRMHSINGYLFGNLCLTCTGDELVRWYTASFGNEEDGPHSPHWHGNIVKNTAKQNTDTLVLIPGTTETVTMKVDNTGEWLYHCHVHDHIEAGMSTTYVVDEKTGSIESPDDSEYSESESASYSVRDGSSSSSSSYDPHANHY